jgi:asparagine synthetase A
MHSGSHVQLEALRNRDLELQPRHSLIMDQWNGQQRAFAIKMFYKNNDSLEGAQKEFKKFPFFCVTL